LEDSLHQGGQLYDELLNDDDMSTISGETMESFTINPY
jgi:hypothetical protein